MQRLAPRAVTGLGPDPADALPSQPLGLPSALAGSAAPTLPLLSSKQCPGPWGSSSVGRVTFSLLTLVQVSLSRAVSCLHGNDWSPLPPPQSWAASCVPVPMTCWSTCHPLSVTQGCCCLHSVQHALALGLLHLVPYRMAVLTDPGTSLDRRGWHSQCLSSAETLWSPTHGPCVASDSLTSGFPLTVL